MLPGRLMAERMALDHVAKVRGLPEQPMRRYRLGLGRVVFSHQTGVRFPCAIFDLRDVPRM